MAALDAVLVDDDIWIRDHWLRAFQKNGKTIKIFRGPSEFLKDCEDLSRETPLFFDFRFQNKNSGVELAIVAHEVGFKRIYISSLFQPQHMKLPNFVEGVIDKEPPKWLLFPNIKSLRSTDKKKLYASMTDGQKKVFKKRMDDYYDYAFANEDALMGVSKLTQEQQSAWESAIYHSLSDHYISKIIESI